MEFPWHMWKARNTVVFNNEGFSPISCLIKAKQATAEWYIRTHMSDDSFPWGHSFTPNHKNYFIVRWDSLPPGFVKLNFDGSCRGSSTSGGFIIRDWLGRLLQVGSYNYGTSSIMVVEVQAMRDGILNTIQARFHQVIVEGDNQTVINVAQCSSRVP